MATNREIQDRIIAALHEKAVDTRPCYMCGKTEWQIGAGYAVIGASQSPGDVNIAGKVYPLIPLVCMNCGNTQLINILRLGFKKEEFESLKFVKDEGK